MALRMLHTCIRVKDIDASMKFYGDVLGLVETRRMEYPKYGFSLIYMSNEVGGYEIELTYNYDQKVPYEMGNGFSHIAIGVDDVAAEREKYKRLGYEVTELKGLPGQEPHYFFVTDPDGYKVEVIKNA